MSSDNMLEHVCSIVDIFHRHIVPYLTHDDVGRLECTCRRMLQSMNSNHGDDSDDRHLSVVWGVLCARDCAATCHAQYGFPAMSAPAPPEDNDPDDHGAARLVACPSWKEAYAGWHRWRGLTGGLIQPVHFVRAVAMWTRLKKVLRRTHVLQSLAPSQVLREIPGRAPQWLPSSMLAVYAVHGGETLWGPTYALLGGYSCYNEDYAMRLMSPTFHGDSIHKIMVGFSVSRAHPRYSSSYLVLTERGDDNASANPEGVVQLAVRHNMEERYVVVGQHGLLAYLEDYVTRLEEGVYRVATIREGTPDSGGICLFPEVGPGVSCCVSHGVVEVKASARWIPSAIDDQVNGLNFGYSIRIRLVAPSGEHNDDSNHPLAAQILKDGCQLVSRHWEFMDGHGTVNRVDGPGVIGKHPEFFWNADTQTSGYLEMGQPGYGVPCPDTTFVYQSQSGPVAGTAQNDTKLASVQGSFSFVPGCIDDPTGPPFHVQVARFPLITPQPFY